MNYPSDAFDLIDLGSVDPDNPDFEQQIEPAVKSLVDLIMMYCLRLKIDLDRVHLNVYALRTVYVSWKLDMLRLKKFHRLKNFPNASRQSAFFVHWMSKIKPVSVKVADGAESVSKCLTINESFALNFAAGVFLKIDMNTARNRALLQKMIYLLYYRGVNPKHLVFTMELLQVVAAQRP